ncbi:knolle [Culex quinquefasciatus]|uniref:Knolle n=1 Tax=Culex quinquefasciatus TaxID=7176 RepID=B0X313_CULQU|nr:knolle [Culex quinquefasciatus]|eukprot:XP_001864035.1 knolle [Culex quinquefasciatus]
MVKDRLPELKKFGEIFSLINDLRRNIREIESQINGQESFKDDAKMAENANLCFRIFSAVKGLQAEMDKQAGSPEVDELVREVRRVQFEGVQSAYIEAYWEYDAIVRRYEEEVKAKVASNTVSLEVINEQSIEAQQEDAQQDAQHDEPTQLQVQLTADDSIEQVEQVLDQLVDRSQELAALEESLLTMRNLFVLFSTLVMEHGSILNLAEGNVQVASEHVAAAVVELKEARKYYRRTNSCRCWCFDMMTILMAILGLLTAILCWMIVKKFLLKFN